MIATEPQRWVGLLERLGLHCRIFKLPEAASEVDARLGPASLHQPQSFSKTSDEAGRINFKCGEHPAFASSSHADLDTSTTELVQRANIVGQVDRIVQWADE